MKENTVAMAKTQQLIKSFGGKFFTATFIKKDGSLRRMTARTGVRKGITGRGNYSHTGDITRSNITVWDSAEMQFRAIPLDRTLTIKHGGVTYKVQ